MKFFRLLIKPDLAAPVLALMFASVVCAGLVATRAILDGNLHLAFLGWNLFLAWLPLIFALLLCEQHVRGGQRHGRLAGLGLAWLLFFPNAPYIFTDLMHLTNRYFPHYWTNMLLILSCALTGLMLGFVSLYIVQSVVADRHGRAAGWLLVAGVAGLSGVGVFMGRFLRFNSWDLLWQPFSLVQKTGDWFSDPLADTQPYIFASLFAVFVFIAYLMFYALTKLPPAESITRAR